MSEHRAGQIVRSIIEQLIGDNVAGGNVFRRRVYAFLGADVLDVTGGLPAVDVFAGSDDPIDDNPYRGQFSDHLLEVIADLYVAEADILPGTDVVPDIDAKASELRLAVQRSVLQGSRNFGLSYVIETYPGEAAPLDLERENDRPVFAYRMIFRVQYRCNPADPVEEAA